MDLPTPVSQKRYREHAVVINDQCIAEAQDRARQEVCEYYGAAPDDIVDVTVSSDGTSLFGAVFILEHETKNVLDYEVLSKFCAACKWQEEHKTVSVCETNFTGSATTNFDVH